MTSSHRSISKYLNILRRYMIHIAKSECIGAYPCQRLLLP